MRVKLVSMLLLFLGLSVFAVAQKPEKKAPVLDTLFTDYDALFSEMDVFLDSLMAPRSFVLFNVSASSGYLNFESKETYQLVTEKKFFYTPSLSYFSKSGLGLTTSASVVHDGKSMNPYQFSVTGSYDYLKNRAFITGVSFAKFFTKQNLGFYTSPLQNAMYTYFTYRRWWIKPTISASYAWGSRSAYSEREEYITSIRLRPTGYTRINTEESINDFSMNVAVRHDFYWLNVLSNNDHVRITPQVLYVSGSQQFGFNQNSNSYGTLRTTNTSVLYNTENITLDDQLYFQPIALTGFLKTEYSKGKVFIQPQVQFDYYFPAKSNKFTTSFVINAGVIF
jgi:hypothetical protein